MTIKEQILVLIKTTYKADHEWSIYEKVETLENVLYDIKELLESEGK